MLEQGNPAVFTQGVSRQPGPVRPGAVVVRPGSVPLGEAGGSSWCYRSQLLPVTFAFATAAATATPPVCLAGFIGSGAIRPAAHMRPCCYVGTPHCSHTALSPPPPPAVSMMGYQLLPLLLQEIRPAADIPRLFNHVVWTDNIAAM